MAYDNIKGGQIPPLETEETMGYDHNDNKNQYGTGYLDHIPESTTPTQTQNQAQDPHSYTDDLIKIYEESKKAEEKAKMRDNGRKMIAGIADAARAINSLVFTAHDAPPTYSPEGSMSDIVRKRIDEATAERRRTRDEQLNFALQQKKWNEEEDALRYQRDKDSRLEDRLANKENREQLKFEAEQEREKALNEAKVKKMEADAAKNEALAYKYEREAYYLALGYDIQRSKALADIDYKQAQKRLADAKAKEANAKASNNTSTPKPTSPQKIKVSY